MSGASRWEHFEFLEIKRVTDKALLVDFGDGEDHWIPLSQVADGDDYEQGDGPGTISLAEWIAKEKGL